MVVKVFYRSEEMKTAFYIDSKIKYITLKYFILYINFDIFLKMVDSVPPSSVSF